MTNANDGRAAEAARPRPCLLVRPDGTTENVACDYEGIKAALDGEAFDTAIVPNANLLFYLDDMGLHKGMQFNMVASVMSGMALFGPVVMANGQPDREGNTLPPNGHAYDVAIDMAEAWRSVLRYAAQVGQDLTLLANPATVPAPQIIPLDEYLSDMGEMGRAGMVDNEGRVRPVEDGPEL